MCVHIRTHWYDLLKIHKKKLSYDLLKNLCSQSMLVKLKQAASGATPGQQTRTDVTGIINRYEAE